MILTWMTTLPRYRVSGGVDASLFDLTSAGVLSFVSVPNYESPQDNGTDNVYALEVEVRVVRAVRVRTAVSRRLRLRLLMLMRFRLRLVVRFEFSFKYEFVG